MKPNPRNPKVKPITKGSGNGQGNGFNGRRGIMAINKIVFDSNLELFVDENLRLKALNPQYGRFNFGENDDNDLNC